MYIDAENAELLTEALPDVNRQMHKLNNSAPVTRPSKCIAEPIEYLLLMTFDVNLQQDSLPGLFECFQAVESNRLHLVNSR